MTNIAISALPSATAATITDLLPIVQSGVTKKITNQLLFTNTTLVTPILGLPQSGTLTNCTGLPVSTGISGFGTGIATFLATPSSANLRSAVTDETGAGALVFANTPTLVTPVLGVATATSINKMAITAPATSSTLAVADGKTFTVSRSLTLTGTDATTMTFPATNATIARTDAAQTFTGNQTFSGAIIGTVQSLSGAGDVDIVNLSTAFTSTATGNALTLADGAVGQIKTIAYVAEAAGADTGILTPTNKIGFTTITFTNKGDSVTLQFFTQGWAVIGVRGATVA